MFQERAIKTPSKLSFITPFLNSNNLLWTLFLIGICSVSTVNIKKTVLLMHPYLAYRSNNKTDSFCAALSLIGDISQLKHNTHSVWLTFRGSGGRYGIGRTALWCKLLRGGMPQPGIYKARAAVTSTNERVIMKTSTLFALFLVGVLTVSWGAADPLPDPAPEPKPEPEPLPVPFFSAEDLYDPFDTSYESFERGYTRKKRQLHGTFGANRGWAFLCDYLMYFLC